MKKLILTALLVFAVSYLYAVPPMPGSGLTHDGSLRWETGVSGEAQYARSSSLNKALKASSVSTTGTKKILVILAKFPGDTRSGKTYDSLDFKAVHTNDFFEDFCGFTTM